MKYTNLTLIDYCDKNNIELINKEQLLINKITRESFIKGKCIYNECINIFNKNFRQLVNTGGYCETCIKIITSKKIKEQKVKYDNLMLIKFINKNNIILCNNYNNTYINRDTQIEGKCLTLDCSNNFIKSFRQLLKINGYCIKCSKEYGKIKIINTNINKYGVENCMQNEEIKIKLKQTNLIKYGCENPNQNEEVKIKKINTNLIKYDCKYTLQVVEIREKIKQSNLIKYGCENPNQNEEVKIKKINTNLIKYGCINPFNNLIIQNKIKQNNLIKYGVEYPSQNSLISEKMFKNSYKLKQYILPSGKIINYQGYENFALNELLNIEKINEEDIITSRKDVPEIWYYDKKNKKRRHFVDFYIKSQNRCIEVKSKWTNQEKNNVIEKQTAGKKLGYIYEIWIYDNKGNKLI